ncbi:hypothetical protein ACI79O_01705 [Geodermatophilus sp. SYSU D00696]
MTAAMVSAGICGALVSVAPLVGGALLGTVGLVGWLGLCQRRPEIAFAVVVAFVVFSSHLFAVAYNFGVPGSLIRVAILTKDVLAWLLLAVLATRAVSEKRPAWPLVAVGTYVAICGAFWFLTPSPAPLPVEVQSIRNALIPALALGSVALLTVRERRRVSVLCVRMVAVAAAYALFELTLPRTFLTQVIGIGPYWAEVKDQPLFLDPETQLPWNFAITAGFPRLTGTFGDPLSAGEVLGAALILAVAYRSALRRVNLTIFVISAALLLSFTRNGWLLAAMGLSVFVILRYGVGRALIGAIATVAVTFGAIQVVSPLRTYLSGILSGDDASTLAHQEALQYSLSLNFPLLGLGWGTGGSGAYNTYAAAVTSENSYVVILTQVGWSGFSLLVLLAVLLAGMSVRRQTFVAAGVAVLLAQVVTGLVSENLLTFNGGFLPFATAGLVAAAPRFTSALPRSNQLTDAPATLAKARPPRSDATTEDGAHCPPTSTRLT